MENYYAPLPLRPSLDFTEIEAIRRAHSTVTDSELAYAVGWEEGALDAAQRRRAALRCAARVRQPRQSVQPPCTGRFP